MNRYEQEKQMVADAAKGFPSTFGLREFPGDVFRIDLRTSYVSGEKVYLYTQIQKGEQWLSFAKGTRAELMTELVQLGGRS